MQPAQPAQPGASTSPGGQSGEQPGSQPGTPDSSGNASPGSNAGGTDTANAAGAFGAAPSAGTGGGDTFNVNMFGDALGRRAVQVTRTRTLADSVRFAGSGSPVLNYSNGNMDLVTLSRGSTVGGSMGGSPLSASLFGVPLGNPTFVAKSPLVGTANHGSSINSPLLENKQVTSQLQQSSLALPGETVRFVSGTGVVANASQNASTQQYSIYQVYNFVTVAQIAAGGGVVGHQKMSEDTSPIPRDRVIFDYDYFSGATLTANGIDVHRSVIGFEKTALDGRMSLEVRVPFASTLDSTSTIGMQSRNLELGDVRITPRFLVYSCETVNVGAGVGIFLPTAADTLVRAADGSDLVRFRNSALSFSPYLGTLYTPNDRLYAQGWVSFDLDAKNTVSANLDGTGLSNIGQYRSGTQMNWDGQLGYWMINPKDCNARFRALGPFVELHYGGGLSNPTTLQVGDFLIGGGGRNDQLNLTAGISAQFGNRLNVQLGATVPVTNSDARSFDWQVGVRVNYLFGAAAEAPDRTTYIVSR